MADITQYCKEKGEGEALILLHGNGESSAYFRHQFMTFAKQYHVWAPDTRGHGRSPRGEGPFTIRRFAEDLRDFMDVHKIEKAHLLGFSDGANIAMVFALQWPERVDRLILDGGNLFPDGVKRQYQLPVEIGFRAAGLLGRCSKKARTKAEMLGLMVNDPALTPEMIAAIQAPTLVMAGTRDMIKEAHTRLIAESIPGARLVFIPGDHFVARKNPTEFNRAVLDFLKSE